MVDNLVKAAKNVYQNSSDKNYDFLISSDFSYTEHPEVSMYMNLFIEKYIGDMPEKIEEHARRILFESLKQFSRQERKLLTELVNVVSASLVLALPISLAIVAAVFFPLALLLLVAVISVEIPFLAAMGYLITDLIHSFLGRNSLEVILDRNINTALREGKKATTEEKLAAEPEQSQAVTAGKGYGTTFFNASESRGKTDDDVLATSEANFESSPSP